MVTNNRSDTIDYLKAMAVVMVVLHHCLVYYYQSSSNVINAVVFLLHNVNVSLFILIAGYLCHEQPIGGYYGNKAKRLFIPFIFFSALKIFYSAYISNEFAHGGNGVLEQAFFSFIFGTQYWFIYVMLIIFFVAPVFWKVDDRLISSRKLLMLIAITLFLSIMEIGDFQLPSYFQFDGVVKQLPFFLIGMILRDNHSKIRKVYEQYKIPVLVICIAVVMVGIYFFESEGLHTFQVLRMLTAIAIMVILFSLACTIKRGNRILRIMSKYSLQIMFLDSFFKVIIFKVAGSVITNIVGVLAVSAVDIFLCIMVSVIMERIPIMNKLIGLGWSKKQA